MKNIWEPQAIGRLSLANGFIRSATFEGLANEEGAMTDSFREAYEELGAGHIGLIITGMLGVTPLEPYQKGMLCLYEEAGRQGAVELVDIIHRWGGKIMAQLVLIGSQVHMAEGEERKIISPSGIVEMKYQTPSVALTVEEIKVLQADMVKAASFAKKAGFDGIQIHGAHGYLISHFLTPYYNHREDDYGGSLENRSRFLLELVKLLKKEIGEDYPLWIKLNCDDFMAEEGFTFEECKQLCLWLEEAGVDAIEISGGNTSSLPRQGVIRPIRRTKEPMYFARFAKEIAEERHIPIGVVGGYREKEAVEELFSESSLAFISLSRPFIREPQLLERWRTSEASPESSLCISCNRCFTGEGTRCIFRT